MEIPGKSISCKHSSPDLQDRKATVVKDLKKFVLERTEFNDGYSYRFDSNDDILNKLNEFVKTERMCCDFFTFQITVEQATVLLKITGPGGAKEFLKEEIDL